MMRKRLLESVLILWVILKYWRKEKQIARMIAYVLEYRGIRTNGKTGVEYESYGLRLFDPDIPGHTCLRVYVNLDSARVYLYEGKQVVACHLGTWVLNLEFMYKDCWKDNHSIYWSVNHER